MADCITISELRTELGVTLEEFARKIGLSSKGHASEVERTERCSLRVALALEELSGGRINAATLNEEVRLARLAVHAAANTDNSSSTSPGKTEDFAAPTPTTGNQPPFPVHGNAGDALAPESEAA